jgi:hypothetical protein
VTLSIGTEYPLANRLRFGACLLLVYEAVRNQLLRLPAMRALLMLQLHGLLLNGLKVGVEALHEGTWRGKGAYFAAFNFRRKNDHSAVAAALFSIPIENPTSPNQNTKTNAAPELSSIQFLQENSLRRIAVITARHVNDEK